MSVGSCSGSVRVFRLHELREEQVQQRPRVGQPVRRDAHVDRHAPAPHVLEPEVVGAGRRVDDRIGEDRQRRVEGRDDAGQRVLRVRRAGAAARRCIRRRAACRPRCRCAISAARWSFSGWPLPDDWRSISPIVRGSSGVSSRYRPRPRKRLRAWSLKNASDDVLLPSFGKNTWPIASRSPTRCSGLGAHGGQRVPAVAARLLVERRERVDRLAVLGAVAGRDVVVLALDVEHDDRVGPVQQVRDHDADALAAARRRRQHHRQLAGQREEAPAVAADQDARAAACCGPRAGRRVRLRPGSRSARRRAAVGAAVPRRAARPAARPAAPMPETRDRRRPASCAAPGSSA